MFHWQGRSIAQECMFEANFSCDGQGQSHADDAVEKPATQNIASNESCCGTERGQTGCGASTSLAFLLRPQGCVAFRSVMQVGPVAKRVMFEKSAEALNFAFHAYGFVDEAVFHRPRIGAKQAKVPVGEPVAVPDPAAIEP